MPRQIGFFVGPGFDLLDLTGPLEAFYIAGAMVPDSYRLSVISPQGGAVRSLTGLSILTDPAAPEGLDTLIIVGGPATAEAPPAEHVAFVKEAGKQTQRIASVCIGAFTLAATGLLDGKAATTHWAWTARLQANYPAVKVDGDRIYTRDNGIWTSAGITAAIDLALALIEEDLGRDIARAVARMLVIYLRRAGGQLQYSSLLDQEPDSDRIRRVVTFARENLDQPLTVNALAKVANLSLRQFGRAFSEATRSTPAKAIERLRVEAARPRIEDGRETLEEIARSVGFSDAARMRQSFIRITGQTPQGIRRGARHQGVQTA